MRKDRKKKEAPRRSDFRSFLKKRAPIYLGLAALFAVFVIPELTKGDLEGSLPVLPVRDQEVVDMLMGYSGPDGSGYTVMEALSDRISEEYPGERIYDDRDTSIDLRVSPGDSGSYRVTLDFESHKGVLGYDWDVDPESGEITPNNAESRHVIDLVDFYD